MAYRDFIGSPLTRVTEQGQLATYLVGTVHPEYSKFQSTWQKCRDAVEGQKAIKGAGEKYLQKMNGQSAQEYENYKERAQWYGATNRTLSSYNGMIFRKPPAINVKLKGVSAEDSVKAFNKEDYYKVVSSKGQGITAFTQDVISEIIQVNRVGVLTDYTKRLDPVVASTLSIYEAEQINYKPYLSMYKAESIINWHYEYIDNVPVPILFVLKEEVYDNFSGGNFFPTKSDLYRVLFLEPYEKDGVLKGRYKEITFRTNTDSKTVKDNPFVVDGVSYPLKDGEYLDKIPFVLMNDCGSTTGEIVNSMIYDLVETNIGHYRNSADLENELHMVGCKTAIFPGWDKKVYGNPVLGGALACPPNCEPSILEASSDSGISTEMEKKESRMSVLGAERIAQKGRYMPSTETAKLNTSSEASNLTGMATFVSQTMADILSFQLQWDKNEDYTVTFTLNTDYYQDDINGEELLKWMDAYQRGGISYPVFYWNLSKRELFPDTWDEDRELNELEADDERRTNLSDEKFASLAERILELEDVAATITATSTGNTMMSVSSANGGAAPSTSDDIGSEQLEDATPRNNETQSGAE